MPEEAEGDPWYILNIGYCADCGVGHLTTKNRDTGKERSFKLSVGSHGHVIWRELPPAITAEDVEA